MEEEFAYLREGLILLSFLSLPVNPNLMEALLDSRCVAFAMETIRDGRGGLPVLTPMSEIAGRLTPQIGAHYLQRPFGGRGILLGGSTGVRPGRVVILGCGIVGSGAARVASGLGASVVVIDQGPGPAPAPGRGPTAQRDDAGGEQPRASGTPSCARTSS